MLTIEKPHMKYKYSTVSVTHLKELRDDIDKLRQDDKLSHNETFLSYIKNKTFELPDEMPNAKFLIIVASYTKLARITFNYNESKLPIFIPPQYYYDGVTAEMIEDSLRQDVLKDSTQPLIRANGVLMKSAAVRSGLGKYGRNNICYVDEMGSFITLLGFFTEYEFLDDYWGERQLMEYCRTCNFCLNNCPTNAIRKENFVIDAAKCVTLYNEVEGEFPKWIEPSVHNAMMGCLRCQYKCPGNRIAAKDLINLGELSAEETRMILNQSIPEDKLQTVCDKLKMFKPEHSKTMLPIISRNLRVILK
ncbi:4Fe-4S double cluster binding domain-containing protein [Candidatus Lokiarchaeum ossiferum]|uniref:4Fe-4S double cluster binding domain-containing protein n=1 Tax=Candidatus Lokiarchaeum ossiferum TaxID=2951803 RepID=UPI00352FC815